MANVDNPLEDRYEEFVGLVKSLCEAYDTLENDAIALSIGVAIRVLVHDTSRSISLLKHLNKKDQNYLSTISAKNKRDGVYCGLVRKINSGVNDGVGGEAKYWPLCDERYFRDVGNGNFINFDDWWSGEKVFKSSIYSLTRKEIILTVVNKDGGAHFDTKIKDKYDNFRKTWSGGSTLVGINSGTSRGYDNIPIYPSVRQIAHELLSSL